MFEKFIITVIAMATLSHNTFSAPKYPFPQNSSYKYGVKATGSNANDIQSEYRAFINEYYEESGSYARIKWDQPSQTVSEGIGYGMLITVYMDNSTNNTRSKFDKLWNYYKNWTNNRGLMHWKIDGFNSVAAENAATDAELDAALALLMAYIQWGDQKYLNDAKDLIGKIWDHEVNDNNYLKPGDAWDTRKNPSYFSTGALELFIKVDSHDWSAVINNSYSLLKKCRNSNTGLVPDWCEENGSPLGDFKYDAVRTPWRIAMAYVWFGHSDAKDIAGTMASWIKGNTGGNPASIVDGYSLNGNKAGAYNNPTFVGPLSAAGMVSSDHQSWVTSGYNRLAVFAGDDGYYNDCLQMLTMLLLTGNMPNFWDNVTPVVNPPENSSFSEEIHIGKHPSQGQSMIIHYTIHQDNQVRLGMYDTKGKLIKTIYNGYVKAGCHTVTPDLSKESVVSGMYILQLKAGSQTFSNALIIAK